MSLKFNEAKHQYLLDGRKVVGVTTLIGAGLPKPAIPYWASRSVAEYVADHQEQVSQLWDAPRSVMVAALKQTPWAIRDAAAIRGTDIHALAVRIVHGEQVDVPEHLVARVEGYARFLDAFRVEPLLTEVPVASRKWHYAGTPDIIGHVRALGDETWCLDWKSSAGVYGETGLQTAAYSKAEFYVNPPDWDTEHPMPEVQRIGVVHITDDGSTLHELGDLETAFKIFTHVQFVAKQVDLIKSLVSDPLEPEAVRA